MGAGSEARLQIHDPAGGRPAGAVLVLHRAGAAAPVLPPDPLEVVHLEHEEGDDPEEDLGARHASKVSASPSTAMGRAAQIAGRGSGSDTGGAVLGGPLRPERASLQRAAARPMPPAKRLISQISASTAATMNSQWTTNPPLNASDRENRQNEEAACVVASLAPPGEGWVSTKKRPRPPSGLRGGAGVRRADRARGSRRPAGPARG